MSALMELADRISRAWYWTMPNRDHEWEPLILGRKGRTEYPGLTILHGERRTAICVKCGRTKPLADMWCKPPFRAQALIAGGDSE